MPTTTKSPPTSEAAIFSRLLLNGKGRLDPALARYILGLGFSASEQTRMQKLAEKNQEGQISPPMRDELFSYVKDGHLLAILHSKARKALKKKR